MLQEILLIADPKNRNVEVVLDYFRYSVNYIITRTTIYDINTLNLDAYEVIIFLEQDLNDIIAMKEKFSEKHFIALVDGFPSGSLMSELEKNNIKYMFYLESPKTTLVELFDIIKKIQDKK